MEWIAAHPAREASMAMNVGESRDGEPVSEINTTPLIDVMLVLLIMLIVTLPPQRHAVKLDTPVPCPACPLPAQLPKPVVVAIAFDGAIKWNDAPVQRAELRRRFAAEARKPTPAEIHIHADGQAPYGAIAHVMASAQREGITRMGVVGGR
jgi:biopolymer transport protein ExbD